MVVWDYYCSYTQLQTKKSCMIKSLYSISVVVVNWIYTFIKNPPLQIQCIKKMVELKNELQNAQIIVR